MLEKKENRTKLIIAIMFSDLNTYNKSISDLKNKFGDIEKESHTYDFNFTTYYEREMGPNLKKKFIVFKQQIKKEDLPDIKLFTTEIEKKYSKEKNRQINLDPGYITKDALVLASFKKGTNYKEKISENIWAHKVLEFKEKKAIEFWHTFPDYKVKENQEFFLDMIKD